jgi:hypothetical protein
VGNVTGSWAKTKIFAVLLLVIVCFSSIGGVQSSSVFSPTWLKKGAYVKYSVSECHIEIPKRRLIVVNGTEVVRNSTFLHFDIGTFRWECFEVNETIANLKIILSCTKENEKTKWEANVYVDIFSRATYLENGTLLGTTLLWLPASPEAGQEIVMYDMAPDKVTMTIEGGNERMQTPQGKQKTFTIAGMKKINGKNAIFIASCDFDTGLTIYGEFSHDPTITALNIISFNGQLEFADTNIDLGPTDDPTDVTTIFVIIAIPTAFIIIFIAVYKRNIKKIKLNKKR